MNENPISCIIPALDKQGNIMLPLNWKYQGHSIVCCIKLSKSEASELAARLNNLTKE